MKRSNQIVLLAGLLLGALAFIGIAILLYQPTLSAITRSDVREVQIQDGRTVTCIETPRGLSCDWDHPH